MYLLQYRTINLASVAGTIDTSASEYITLSNTSGVTINIIAPVSNDPYTVSGCNVVINMAKAEARQTLDDLIDSAKVAVIAGGESGICTLTVQGELCAPGIQSNRLKLTKPEWYVFTIMENGKRVGLKRMQEVCSELGFTTVPIEEVDTDLPAKYPTVEALLVRADGNYPNGGKKEGIVIRPTEPVFSASIGAELSMKVVSNKYLLKNGG